MSRSDGRAADKLRTVKLQPGYVTHPEGSVLISTGDTKVLCNVTVEDRLPPWMNVEPGTGGWITAEYAMLPRSTHTRTKRETKGLKGRTQEISRLIGRSLRAGFDMDKFKGRSFLVDCDVIQADGGTRTAAITGAYCAVCLALKPLVDSGEIAKDVYRDQIAAVSVGIINGQALLDLCYEEDVRADVDANLVLTAQGKIIEVQGTAEGESFSREELSTILDLGLAGTSELHKLQSTMLEAV